MSMDRKTQYCQEVLSNLIYRTIDWIYRFCAIPTKTPESYFMDKTQVKD